MQIDSEAITFIKPTKETEFTVTITHPRSLKLPGFSMIGREIIENADKVGIPVISLLLGFNKEEQWFFGLLMENFQYETNISNIKDIEFNKSNANRASKAYALLNQKGLVKRISNRVFMVSPDAFIFPKYYERNKKHWDSI